MTYSPESSGDRQPEQSLFWGTPESLASQSLAAQEAAADEQPASELVIVELRDRKVDPVQANLERLKDIMAEMRTPFERAIEDGDGSEPHHAAELAHLDEMRVRIAGLIHYFSVKEPVNEAFVREAIEGLDALAGAQGQYRQDYLAPTQREAIVDQAVAAARTAGQESA